ncbi:MAG: helix-turn-helix domain-containing protein [Verrucomicrobiae bacterium]|nr:helix-turn-helix domain-containing protein [Verrucomicrobiae bacterium]
MHQAIANSPMDGPATCCGRPRQECPNPAAHSTAGEDRDLVDALLHSEIYREFQHAFGEATGLPVALCSAAPERTPRRRKSKSPFCAMISTRKDGCAFCQKMSERLSRAATRKTATLDCAFGLTETAVPIRLGERVIAFLRVGQVFRFQPTSTRFDRAVRQLTTSALNGASRRFRSAYFKTPVVTEHKYRSIVKMLDLYARYFAVLANQIATRRTRHEPPMVVRAREFIRQNHGEKLSLTVVARAVGMSRFHFCKVFKKATGTNFTAHLARVRVESAQSLLLDPHLRVSEVAFHAGFQSLAHFNRVFRRIAGESPTAWRAHLPACPTP